MMRRPTNQPLDHLAELERRLDVGDTYEQHKKSQPPDLASIQAGRIDPGGATNYKHTPLPVSMTMPKTREKGTIVNRFGRPVRQLASGHLATLAGVRIVDSKKARDFHAGDSGMVVRK